MSCLKSSQILAHIWKKSFWFLPYYKSFCVLKNRVCISCSSQVPIKGFCDTGTIKIILDFRKDNKKFQKLFFKKFTLKKRKIPILAEVGFLGYWTWSRVPKNACNLSECPEKYIYPIYFLYSCRSFWVPDKALKFL